MATATLRGILKQLQARLKETDASGHEHKPAGPGGGQFTGHGGGGGGGGGGSTGKPAKKPRKVVQRSDKTTWEGVDKDRAKKLTPEEAREALEFKDGMTLMVGSNKPNAGLPDATRPDLSDLESGALQKYSFKNDGPLNAWLRTGTLPEGTPYNQVFFDEMHAALKSAFDKAPVLDKPVKVVRGMQLEPEALEKFIGQIKGAGEAGEPVTLKGYTSTAKPGGLLYKMGLSSGIPGPFRGNVSLTINAVHGLDVKPYSQLTGEGEMLLPHGAQFRVRSMTKKKDGWHIELDQIAPSGKKRARVSVAKFLDEQGHEHRPPGPAGGQFTSGGSGGGSGSTGGSAASPAPKPSTGVTSKPDKNAEKKREREETAKFRARSPHALKGPSNTVNLALPDEARPSITEKRIAEHMGNYCWGYDGEMNAALRKTGKPPPGPFGGDSKGKPNKDGPQMFADLQDAFARVKPFKEPVDVLRGIPLEGDDLVQFEAAARASLASGEPFVMKGFISTGTKKTLAPNFGGASVKLKIKAVHGLDMRPYSEFPGEKELLLNHGSKFTVTKVEKVRGQLIVHLAQHPPEKGASHA